MATAVVKTVGSWSMQRTLGQGGFGTVTLWENKDTNETLALKQCRVSLDAKNTKRWKMEIEIMNRLDHKHIVRAKEVPGDLQLGQGELPLLGMEYCRRGDLRKILCRPENCCGLKQEQVLIIAKHICSGVEYLHSKRIIHRDLKPENIVIQEDDNGQLVYKLIDLGYAKDMDQGSVASTFVGTLQYLAPELFASQKYNATVDYWTLGTVIFECITGSRPFLPQMPPVKWHGTVKQKTDEEICAYLNAEGNPIFTESLLSPNHLTPLYCRALEMLLRIMLKFEPEKRGGGTDAETQRPACFVYLDKLLAMQVINVLFINKDTLHNYAIRETDKVLFLQRQLQKDTGVPVSQQELLLPTGQSVASDKLAMQCTKGENQPGFLIFLFDKRHVPDSLPGKARPEFVNLIIQEPKTLLSYNDRKKAWGQALYYCSQQAREASRLLEGARAAMLCLMRLNHQLTDLHKNMLEQMNKIEAKSEMFRSSFDFDISSYAMQSASGITSEKMFRSWKNAERDVLDDVEGLRKVYALGGQVNVTQTKIMELQRSPLSRQKQVEDLEDVEKAAYKLYRELQQSKSSEGALTFQDSVKMQSLLMKSINCRSKQTKELFGYMQKLVKCKIDAENLVPKITAFMDEIKSGQEQMVSFQLQRQRDIWTLLKHAVGKVNSSAPSSMSSAAGAATVGSTYSRQSSAASASSSSSDTSPAPPGMLQSINPLGSKPLQDSLMLVNQSSMAITRFDEEFESMKEEQVEILKATASDMWGFLKSIESQ